MKIGIVGLGLIGGSLAKALSARTDHEIAGLDTDPEVMRAAKEDGAISEGSALAGSDVVFVCLHPQAAVQWMLDAQLAPGTIVADTCGIKRFVQENVEEPLLQRGLRYVGTHPMAGREVGGYGSSMEDLFSGCSWILVRSSKSDMEAMRTLGTLVRIAGAGSVPVSTAKEHDRIIAYTSQMAHVVSNAYVKNEAALEERGFSAGSFQDLTRVARLDPKLWTELFLANSRDLVENLDEFIANVRSIRDCIAQGRRDELEELLAEGSRRRISLTRMEKTAAGSLGEWK